MNEESKNDRTGKFITLTFSNEEIDKLIQETGIQESNAVETIAVRRFLERWRKKYKKSGLNPGWEDIKKQDEFKQFLPSKGFVGYLVGTDYLGISKQIKIDGDLSWTDGDSNVIKVDSENDWENLNSTIDGQEIYSILEINDIPEGTYIFRLASHLWNNIVTGKQIGRAHV